MENNKLKLVRLQVNLPITSPCLLLPLQEEISNFKRKVSEGGADVGPEKEAMRTEEGEGGADVPGAQGDLPNMSSLTTGSLAAKWAMWKGGGLTYHARPSSSDN